MTSGLRWRILTLQVVLIVSFSIAAGFLFWASNYTHSTIKNQLTAQLITFPAANSAEISALPAADADAMKKYAGQTMSNGDQAKTYANDFMKVHLAKMGMTYSQASAAALAHPNNASDAALADTIFKGTTLRGMLLNSYGWWTMGTYMWWAGIVAALAAIAVFIAFLYEIWAANRSTPSS